jgi:cytochrome c5
MVELGDRIYRGQLAGAACVGCHGDRGQGSPLGPELTGKKWLWSDGSWEGITKTITDGVSQPKQYRSPMPPMGGAQLTLEQVKAVAAYVWAISHLAKGNSSSAGAPAEIAGPGERIFPESLISTSDGLLIIRGIGTRSIFSVDRGAFAEAREICGGSGNSQDIQSAIRRPRSPLPASDAGCVLHNPDTLVISRSFKSGDESRTDASLGCAIHVRSEPRHQQRRG